MESLILTVFFFFQLVVVSGFIFFRFNVCNREMAVELFGLDQDSLCLEVKFYRVAFVQSASVDP